SRYRHYAAFERATFEHGKPTQLLMLTNKQIADFQKHYQTEAELQVHTSGANTVISVDRDGVGSAFKSTDLVTLENVQLTLNDLL
ncbi:hypothetical protein MJL79_30240, partial [Salmonella enterica subsp. enterica serovar Montevideo]|nr:hypothetical protein [Salmonella enterica subsp. enterica serovar Montevideo]